MPGVLSDTFTDVIKLLPFLFLTYLAMEYMEHKMGERAEALVKKAGCFGPVIGGLLGIVPQCGFAAAAANLYAGRVITVGTLIAIYLSTSDEMLPVLISKKAPPAAILGLLLAKAAIGITAGLLLDLLRKSGSAKAGKGYRPEQSDPIHDMCVKEHCGCEKGVLRSALSHTAQISLFILLLTFLLNLALFLAGEDVLAGILLDRPFTGPLLAGLVGLIPNCAGSVAITQLYLEGVIGIGPAMAGLLTGSGVGLLVLFRVNRSKAENIRILLLLYAIGVLAGMMAQLVV